MTLRRTLLALFSLVVLGGCTSSKVMQPRTAALSPGSSSQTRCVGELCFVYAEE